MRRTGTILRIAALASSVTMLSVYAYRAQSSTTQKLKMSFASTKSPGRSLMSGADSPGGLPVVDQTVVEAERPMMPSSKGYGGMTTVASGSLTVSEPASERTMMPSTKLPILAFEPPTPQPSQTGMNLAHEEVNYVLPVQTSKPSAEPKPRTMMSGTKKIPYVFQQAQQQQAASNALSPTSKPPNEQQPRTIMHGTKAGTLTMPGQTSSSPQDLPQQISGAVPPLNRPYTLPNAPQQRANPLWATGESPPRRMIMRSTKSAGTIIEYEP